MEMPKKTPQKREIHFYARLRCFFLHIRKRVNVEFGRREDQKSCEH